MFQGACVELDLSHTSAEHVTPPSEGSSTSSSNCSLHDTALRTPLHAVEKTESTGRGVLALQVDAPCPSEKSPASREPAEISALRWSQDANNHTPQRGAQLLHIRERAKTDRNMRGKLSTRPFQHHRFRHYVARPLGSVEPVELDENMPTVG